MKFLSILLVAIWGVAAILVWQFVRAPSVTQVTVLPTTAVGEPSVRLSTATPTPWLTVTALPTDTPMPPTRTPTATPTYTLVPITLVVLPTATPYVVTATPNPLATPYIVTATPNPFATLYVVTATPQLTATPILACACSADLYNCRDFRDQTAAQACFVFCAAQGLGDIHRLDQNKNNIACEDWD